MEIGVIGIGNIGGTLARKLATLGHKVKVANSGSAAAVSEFARDIGAYPEDAQGAVHGAEVIILSIPFLAIPALSKDLFANVPPAVPIIDTSNYYPDLRDSRIAEIDAGMTESVWVSREIGQPVIKAFNNIMAHSLAALARPAGSEGRLALAVAGDDAAAKAITMNIIDQIGFDPIDAGALQESWRQQPGTPGYCCDYGIEDMRRGLVNAVKGEAPAIRDNWQETYGKLPENATHEDMIALNRSINISSAGS